MQKSGEDGGINIFSAVKTAATSAWGIILDLLMISSLPVQPKTIPPSRVKFPVSTVLSTRLFVTCEIAKDFLWIVNAFLFPKAKNWARAKRTELDSDDKLSPTGYWPTEDLVPDRRRTTTENKTKGPKFTMPVTNWRPPFQTRGELSIGVLDISGALSLKGLLSLQEPLRVSCHSCFQLFANSLFYNSFLFVVGRLLNTVNKFMCDLLTPKLTRFGM